MVLQCDFPLRYTMERKWFSEGTYRKGVVSRFKYQ